jgi:hypothetical protein
MATSPQTPTLVPGKGSRVVNFSERPPSNQWAALKYRGEKLVEVWFKPQGEPFALTFRVPQTSFHLPGVGQFLTPENLLKAVGIAAAEVESWHHEGQSQSAAPELGRPLSPPDAAHLTIHVRLKSPLQAVAATAGGEADIPEARWQDLEARWDAVLRLEASVDTLRISMEALRGEMEAATRKMLTADEKVHALNADVAQWTKAKTRVLHSLPKARDFIHRSTWAVASPERKKLEEVFKNHIQPRVPFPESDQVLGQIEHLLKDRQVLSALGNAAYQDCKSSLADAQGTLRTLLANAKANATRKRGTNIAGGQSF